MSNEEIITQAYQAFNKRQIDQVLTFFDPEVDWPNGWEGGYVHGHKEVNNYWERQWAEINPTVEPTAFETLANGRLKVTVQQHLEDLTGIVLFSGTVCHTYTFENGLIRKMEISDPILSHSKS